jgi:hypothetical protein
MNNNVRLMVAIPLLFMANVAHAQIGIYLNAPRTSNSIFSNTTVETFNSLATGNITSNYTSAIGTYQASTASPLNIERGNVAWAFDGTKHMAVGAQSGSTGAVSLLFANQQSYFGFGWAAGDSQNRMDFYRGNTLLGSFSSATIQSILSGPTVTTVNGSTYQSSTYKGQPASPSTNSGENYAFVNFFAQNGFKFDRIDFWNNNTGSGFESDNHTILSSGTATPSGSLIYVTSTVNPVGLSAPEPSLSLGLLLVLPIALGFTKRRTVA